MVVNLPTPPDPGGRRSEARPDPFDRLFLSHYPRVVAIAGRIAGDADAAQDIAQDVFCDFHRRYVTEVPFASAWLHAAAAHAALNHLRGGRRRAARELRHTVATSGRRSAHENALDPQQVLEREETRRQVRRVLTRMPRRHASVLALRYSGLSYGEVADALGVGVGQVGTLLRRAELRFHKEMTRDAHSDD